jgi:nicotinamidase-related amidase
MKKALFVIDVQGFFKNKKTKSIAKKINSYIKNNKDTYSFIIFTIFKNTPESPATKILGFDGCSGGEDIEILGELSEPLNGSKIIFRNVYSLFKVAEVQNKLKEYKIEQVDICGFDTDCCVMATTYDLFDSGYKPVVLEKLCFSTSKEGLHKPALKIIKRNCAS